jgi:LysR family nitrogen assimilation transcriptional regulator
MELRQLRYFVAIVDLGSLSAAARSLRIAQPALSQQVRKLESELGVSLLERSVRGVVVTEAGRVLYRNAQAVLRQVEQARAQVRSSGATPSGMVSVGFPTTVAATLALPIFMEARRRYPKITLRITESLSGHLAEEVASGKLDMAFLYGSVVMQGMLVEALFEEELFLVMRAGFRKGHRRRADLGQLASQGMLLPSRAHGLRHAAEQIARDAGAELRVIAEIDSLPVLKGAVELGAGITILPWSAVSREVEERRLMAMPLAVPSSRRLVALCMSSVAPPSTAAIAVFELIKEVASRLAASKETRGVSRP